MKLPGQTRPTRLYRTEEAPLCRAALFSSAHTRRWPDSPGCSQVKKATRAVADEVLKDSAVAVREVEKALLDYEQPMKGFPGGLLGI